MAINDHSQSNGLGDAASQTVSIAPLDGDAAGRGEVSISDDLLLSGDFSRTGSDLLITAPGGEVTLVPHFFAQELLPDLVSHSGARMDGDWAGRLAGPAAPAQYAQSSETAAEAPIGTVESLTGSATVTHTDGSQSALQEGDPIFQGDMMETGSDGAVGVLLADDTTFSLGENGAIVMDELVYDPGIAAGEATINIVKGVFTFVSGQIAKTGTEAMVLKTPVATIGIRGTSGGVEVEPPAPGGPTPGQGGPGGGAEAKMTVILTPDPDGSVGEMSVTNGGGTQVINQPFQGTSVASFNAAPQATFTVDQASFNQSFGQSLSARPPSPAYQQQDQEQQGPEGEEQAEGEGEPKEGEGEPQEGEGEPQEGDPEQQAEGEGEPVEGEGEPQEGEGEPVEGEGEPQEGEGEPQEGDPEQQAEGEGEPQDGEPQEGEQQAQSDGEPQEGEPQEGEQKATGDAQEGEPEGEGQQADGPQEGGPEGDGPQEGGEQNAQGEQGPEGEQVADAGGEPGNDQDGEPGAEPTGEPTLDRAAEPGQEPTGEPQGGDGQQASAEQQVLDQDIPESGDQTGGGDQGSGDGPVLDAAIGSNEPAGGTGSTGGDTGPTGGDTGPIGGGSDPIGGGGGFGGSDPLAGGGGGFGDPISGGSGDGGLTGGDFGDILGGGGGGDFGGILGGGGGGDLGDLANQQQDIIEEVKELAEEQQADSAPPPPSEDLPPPPPEDGGSTGNTITGTSGNDTITGTNGDDIAYGLAGADTFVGGLGTDTIADGDGTDFAFLSDGWDPVSVERIGNDMIVAYQNDTGTQAGSVRIIDQYGGAYGSVGVKALMTEDLHNSPTVDSTGIIADANAYLATGVIDSNSNALTDYDSAIFAGTTGDDVVSVTTAGTLAVGASKDIIFAGGIGDDTFTGGAGDDVFVGGVGSDNYTGGAHNSGDGDEVYYEGAIAGIDAHLANGSVIHGTGTDILSGIENVTGSQYADIITGDTNANKLWGEGGNDTLSGGAGDDWLEGYTGDDTLIGGSGTDTADYEYAGSAVTVNLASGTATGGHGNDTLTSIENVYGSAYADIITGDGNANSLNGYKGDDTFIGSGGIDTIDGGDGTDKVDYTGITGNHNINLVTGSASINGTANNLYNIENVTTCTGDDWIDASSADNSLDGGGGTNDTVSFVYAGSAVTASLDSGSASGGSGNDVFTNFENIVGSNHNDILAGDGSDNELWGKVGVDTLDGMEGSDTYKYNSGELSSGEIISDSGASGTDKISLLYSGSADFTVATLSGIEQLVFNSGGNNAVLSDTQISGISSFAGGAGTDVLTLSDASTSMNLTGIALTSIESINTGAGSDTVMLDDTSWAGVSTVVDGDATGGDSDVVQLTSSAATVDLATGKTFTNIESVAVNGTGTNQIFYGAAGIVNTITASTGDDRLYGDTQVDTLSGGGGNDTLDGGQGADSLLGGSGDDLFKESTSTGNYINGGTGTDTVDYSLHAGPVTVNLFDNSGTTDTLIDVEIVKGTGANDSIFLSNATDHGETAYGGGGVDVISGLNGVDVMYGEAGVDTIDGGSGHDSLHGGAGADSLTGGTGNDHFYHTGAADGIDILMDFGVGDILHLEGTAASYDFNAGTNVLSDLAGGTYGAQFMTYSPDATTFGGGEVAFAGGGQLKSDDANNGNYTGTVGGDDLLIWWGTAGGYNMYGYSGDDRMIDVSTGDTNQFIGGQGSDYMDGGTGTIDQFRWDNTLGTGDFTAGDIDTVIFESGEKLVFNNATVWNTELKVAGVTMWGNAQTLGTGGFSNTGGSETNIYFDATADEVRIDLDNSGAYESGNDFAIKVAGASSVAYDGTYNMTMT